MSKEKLLRCDLMPFGDMGVVKILGLSLRRSITISTAFRISQVVYKDFTSIEQ